MCAIYALLVRILHLKDNPNVFSAAQVLTPPASVIIWSAPSVQKAIILALLAALFVILALWANTLLYQGRQA